MKQILSIIFFTVIVGTQLNAAACFGISTSGADQVTISVTPNQDYTAAPQFFWTTGLVTVSWPESEGAGFVGVVTNLNGFSWSKDGGATLETGTYYQKIQFTTQNNVMAMNGVPLDVFSLSVTTPAANVSMEISETPPAAVINGNASFANVLADQFGSGGCTLSAIILPVELTQFQVNKKGDENALVTWQTASEVNTSHFDVERSLSTC